MKNALLSMLSSVKFWTQIIGLIINASASLLAKYGIGVSDATVMQISITIAGLFGALGLAQGATDHGKAAAQIAATTTTKTVVEPPGTVVETKTPEVTP